MKKAVIIVAGGSGKRFNSDLPKQFLELLGKPVLQHTIQKFIDYDKNIKLILVLPSEHIDYWTKTCGANNFKTDYKIVEGGAERFYSVKNAIDVLEEVDLVAVHDGVRPCIDKSTIENAFKSAGKYGNAVPVINAFDSVRFEKDDINYSVDRNNVKLIQTPQVFKFEILKKAYQQEYKQSFTDDASVVEQLGVKIFLSEGSRKNIKITTAEDLKIAEFFMKNNNI